MVAKVDGAITHSSAIIFFCFVGLLSTFWMISIFRLRERLLRPADAIMQAKVHRSRKTVGSFREIAHENENSHFALSSLTVWYWAKNAIRCNRLLGPPGISEPVRYKRQFVISSIRCIRLNFSHIKKDFCRDKKN